MENWEAGANLLKAKHFELPKWASGNMRAEITRHREVFGLSASAPTSVQDTASACNPRHQEPVRRHYRPDTAAIDELVEALYQLLMDVPANTSALAESTCFQTPSRARNVS
jgi:hypothetical protein